MIQTIGWVIVGSVIVGLTANACRMLWEMWREGDRGAGFGLLAITLASVGFALIAVGLSHGG